MLDIVLIVLGLGIIGGSYVISEKVEAGLQGKNAEDSTQIKDIWTEKDEKRVRERIDSIVEESVELAIDKTEDELSRISNEKIMVSNEFSEQVLEKIEQNHEEVVFLYNMLNEKEKQMKTLMQEIETLRSTTARKVEEEKESVKAEKTMTAVDMLEKLHKTAKPVEVVLPEAKETEMPVVQLSSSDEREISRLREFAKSIEEDEQAKVDNGESKERSLVEENVEQTESSMPEEKKNRNEEILTLHKQGMTVLEISKALDMGQGEVKLIIDLFQGANK